MHDKVKKHIKTTYPYVVISAGLGENPMTDFIRMDNNAKGYTKGQPDLELQCKLGSGVTDVVAVDLKNPDNSNKTTPRARRLPRAAEGVQRRNAGEQHLRGGRHLPARALQGRQ